MITHEQARNFLNNITGGYNNLLIYDYINQQEKKDEQHKTEIENSDKTIIYLQEELDKCNISDTSKEESSMFYFNEFKTLERKQEKKDELLGLYRELSKHHFGKIWHIEYEQINKLETSLKGE